MPCDPPLERGLCCYFRTTISRHFVKFGGRSNEQASFSKTCALCVYFVTDLTNFLQLRNIKAVSNKYWRGFIMISLAKLSRKIGLGFRPSESFEIDPTDWIEAQLGDDFTNKAIKTITSTDPPIVDWPKELDFGLTERVNRLVTLRGIKDRLQEDKVDDVEFIKQQMQAEKDYSVQRLDIYKFAHSASYNKNQVKLRLAHFWLNHFTVGLKETTGELIGHYFDEAIYARLSGSFDEMLYGITSHPAMLTYLDNIYNIGENSRKAKNCGGRSTQGCTFGLNDNLARELMELHTVSPTRQYTEDDIHNAAKILAGWGGIFDKPFSPKVSSYWNAYVKSTAEPGLKTVLNFEFQKGSKSLRSLTDMLAADKHTRNFLSRKLATHFIGENVSKEDIAAIAAAWEQSSGDLPTIHSTVLNLAYKSPIRKFLWPSTWLFQAIRLSGADLFKGYDDLYLETMTPALRDPDKILSELGNSFWSERQPNGYSDRKSDWVSTEHLDRRIRISELIFRSGNPKLQAEEIAEMHDFSDQTKLLLTKGKRLQDKFVLLLCSPEFMEV